MIAPSNYVLGQSTHEYERLMLQARILPLTPKNFFRTAGVARLVCGCWISAPAWEMSRYSPRTSLDLAVASSVSIATQPDWNSPASARWNRAARRGHRFRQPT